MGGVSETIDFVVPWVDGGDPAWQAEKERHAAEAHEASCQCVKPGKQASEQQRGKGYPDKVYKQRVLRAKVVQSQHHDYVGKAKLDARKANVER